MIPGLKKHIPSNIIRACTMWVVAGVLFGLLSVPGYGSMYGSMRTHDDLSIEQADQLIVQVFSSLDAQQYETAIEAYYSILKRITTPLEEAEEAIVSRHVRAIALIMDEAEQTGLGIDVEQEGAAFLEGFVPHISDRLIRWWRLQDVVPATSINDRLIEHLQRVVVARTEYELPVDPRGFDDRGAIYIRLGAPSIKTNIRLLSTELQQNGVGLRIPPNEFWVYTHVAYDAHYIFTRLRTRSGYQLSTPLDLIPRRLQNSRRYTQTLLLWMEEVYGQLALGHNIYGALYDQVINYRALPSRNEGRADVFAQGVVHNASVEDEQLVYQRDQNVPTAYTNRFGSAAQLDIPYRWARFLEQDGRTRLEVYWSVEPQALVPRRRFVRRMYKEGHVPSDDYLVSVYSALRGIDLTDPEGVEKHYLTDAGAKDKLPVKSISILGDTALLNLTLHWEQRWTIPGPEEESLRLPGALLKFRSQVVDSIQALHADGEVLEVSDLKVLHFREGTLPYEGDPFPYEVLDDTTQIAVYFEVYNLAYQAEDRTEYTITYAVNESKEKKSRGTTASTSHVGDNRNTEEYIVPDLSKVDVSKGVEIVLTIRDDVTGEERQRLVRFQPR